MNDFIELLKFLYEAGTAIIPWVVFVLVVFLVLKLYPHIVVWIQARVDAQKNLATREAERNEIMRNNSVVITNNTETMAMMKRFIEDTERSNCSAIQKHEELSAERMDNIQKVIDNNSVELSKVRGEIAILLDRTN